MKERERSQEKKQTCGTHTHAYTHVNMNMHILVTVVSLLSLLVASIRTKGARDGRERENETRRNKRGKKREFIKTCHKSTVIIMIRIREIRRVTRASGSASSK